MLFDEVDVVTLIESELGAVAIPHVIRAANRRTLREIHAEIRRVQAKPATSAQRSGLLKRLSSLTPGFLRRSFLRGLKRNPHWLKQTAGTTLVTAVGMFGSGAGWAVGLLPLHTLALTVGGIAQRPGIVDGAWSRGSTSRSPSASITTSWTARRPRGSRSASGT